MERFHKELIFLSRVDPTLGRAIREIGPCRFRPDKKRSISEALVYAVAHQQIHGKAAKLILARFLALTPQKEGERFPDPKKIARMRPRRLRSVGFSEAKVKAILDISKNAARGKIPHAKDTRRMESEHIIQLLLPLRGVGSWTAEMIIMFTLGRMDVLPIDDFGIREGFRIAYKKRVQPTPQALRRYGARWAPYRTIASWYLWRIADGNNKFKM